MKKKQKRMYGIKRDRIDSYVEEYLWRQEFGASAKKTAIQTMDDLLSQMGINHRNE